MTNEEVLAKIGIKRQLLNTFRKRQWGFIGHELSREGGGGRKKDYRG